MLNSLEATWLERGHGGMADATDLKSVDRKVVRVQVPLPPSKIAEFSSYVCGLLPPDF